MHVVINEYETIYVMKPELPTDAMEKVSTKITSVIGDYSGSVLMKDDWGKRKLAYQIQKNTRGHYVLINYLATPDVVAEIERHLRIDDTLLRFLTIRLAEDANVETRNAEAVELNAKRAEEAKARAEANAKAEAEREAAQAEREARRAAAEKAQAEEAALAATAEAEAAAAAPAEAEAEAEAAAPAEETKEVEEAEISTPETDSATDAE
jgi:small subunit ribosomal protein S6